VSLVSNSIKKTSRTSSFQLILLLALFPLLLQRTHNRFRLKVSTSRIKQLEQKEKGEKGMLDVDIESKKSKETRQKICTSTVKPE